MIVDALDAQFVEDISRAMSEAIESVVDASDFPGGDVVAAVLGLAVAVATDLGYDATTAYELGFGAVSVVFLDGD